MNREEFIKYQEERIAELFPPEHRRKVAECAQEMLDDAYEQMEFWYGKGWREEAKARPIDILNEFMRELRNLMREYEVVIAPSVNYDNGKPIVVARYKDGTEIGDDIFEYKRDTNERD